MFKLVKPPLVLRQFESSIMPETPNWFFEISKILNDELRGKNCANLKRPGLFIRFPNKISSSRFSF